MEPLQLIRTIRRRWRPLVLLALLGGGLGAASAAVGADASPIPVPVNRHDACHVLLVDNTIPDDMEQLDVRSNLAQLAERVTQGEIPDSVAAQVGADPSFVASQVRVMVRNDVHSLEICAVAETPGASVELADAYASALVQFLETEALELQDERVANARARSSDAQACRDSVEAQITALLQVDASADVFALEQQRAECRLQLTSANADLVRYQSAGAPVVPLETLETAEAATITERTYERRLRSGAAGTNVTVQSVLDGGAGDGGASTAASPSRVPDGPLARGAMGLAAGLALGAGLVLFTERLDPRLRRKDDVESVLDLPVIAEIPPLGRKDRKDARILARDEPRSRMAESYRALRSAIDYAHLVEQQRGEAGDGALVVLVTSAGPGEGKTTTIANLAAVMAEGDLDVLAVNCDFRRPRLHRYLGGPAGAQQVNETDIDGVSLVTQVTAADAESSPSDVVAAQRRLVERAKDRFDVILLDTAPVLTTNDAAEVLGVVDHVLLVISSGSTNADDAARATELLERRGKSPLGVVLVGAREVPNSSDYYYDDDDPYLQPRRRQSTKPADVEPVDDDRTDEDQAPVVSNA